MRGETVKKIKKCLKIPHLFSYILLEIRNNCGEKTKVMTDRQIYQNTKKLFCAGKIELPKRLSVQRMYNKEVLNKVS